MLTFFENNVKSAVEREWTSQLGYRNARCPQSGISKHVSLAGAGDADAIFNSRLCDVLRGAEEHDQDDGPLVLH